MVQLTESEGPNQQRGNKRPLSNAGDDNQGGGNPRGDQGGKFQRRSFGDRGPFNKGGDRPFNNGNRFNRGGPFNKDNNFNRGRNQNFGQGRDNQNFNRGRNNQNFQGRNNQNFRQGGFQNNRFNKSWEGNGNDNAADFEQNNTETKHKKFAKEVEIEEAANTVNTQPKNKNSQNTALNIEQKEDEASSSESDQEVETNLQNNQKVKENEDEEETSSESEEEIGTNANLQENQNEDDETSSESEEEIETVTKTVQKLHKNEKEEMSSSENEEETVTNASILQNNQSKNEDKKKSTDEIEANNSQEPQVKIVANEDNTSTTEKPNKKTGNKDKERCTVYVGSLPVSATKQQIKKFFKRYGKIEDIEFRSTDDEYSAVNIIFEKKEDGEKAVEVNGMMYKDHRLSVFIFNGRRTDKSTSVFAEEIPLDITLGDLWDAFESTYGPVSDIVLPISKTGRFRHAGFAFIEFQAADSKELALADKQITIKDKIIKVKEQVEQKKLDRTSRVHNGRIHKLEPRRFSGGPRYSNGPRRFSRDFAGGPGNIKVHNTPGNSITISLGNDSFQGRPSFNGRPKFNARNNSKGRGQ